MIQLAKRAVHSAGFYPITALYVVACLLLVAVVQAALSLATAALILAVVAILTVLSATWRELVNVRTMVDGQRTEMIDRMDTLVSLLADNDIKIPAAGPKENQARHQNAAPQREGAR